MLLSQIDDLTDLESLKADLLVVDNDPAGGAAEVIEEIDDPRLRYAHEPRPGLSAVRNRAIEESASSRILAFMDDDGRPADGWLRHLIDTWEVEKPASIAGRVIEEYESTPEPWIVAGQFFQRPSFPTGTEVTAAAAGNLMLDLDDIRESKVRFDPRFGLSGAEDTFLTRQLTAAGHRIVWCDESRVVDQVPTSRLDRRWLLQRTWSHGNSATLVERALAQTPSEAIRVRAVALAGGLLRVVSGGARYAVGVLLFSDRHKAGGLRVAFRGAGMIAGALGHVVEEYSR